MQRSLVIAAVFFFFGVAHSISLGATLTGSLEVSGSATDLSTVEDGTNFNRLGGFGSDLYYDRFRDEYYGLVDRGPGGGYQTRVQRFKLEIDPATGALSNFQLQATIPFKVADGNASFVGSSPLQLYGDASILGLSFDPEGFVVAPNGHFFVSDEFGPSLYEFAPVAVDGGTEARLQRAFSVPDMFRPIDNFNQTNYTAERTTSPTLVRGRQDNRGFEGLAISPDGTTLYAALQDPLAQEGISNQGRRSRNVRIVKFDAVTGESTGQFLYQLEDVATANQRIPGTANDFRAQDQGRDIGISSLVALNDHELLVLERDTRGVSAANPVNADPLASAVAIKRIYSVDLTGASDVSTLDLTGTSTLPAGVTPLAKSLLLDMQAELANAGEVMAERIEGLVVGPRLSTGEYALVAITDNDFSINFSEFGERFDVYTDGTTAPVDSPLNGKTLLPTHLFSFAAELPSYVAPVPEPSTGVMLALALLILSAAKLRRR